MNHNKRNHFGQNNPRYRHGMVKTRFWNIWRGMKDRCMNKNSHAFKDYGERGIRVVLKWVDFLGFYEDMYSSYFENATIERIDVNKGYYKENCRWVTQSEQSSNTRKNLRIIYKGRTMILKDWAKELRINYQTLRNRIVRYRMPVDQAFVEDINYAGRINNKRNF